MLSIQDDMPSLRLGLALSMVSLKVLMKSYYAFCDWARYSHKDQSIPWIPDALAAHGHNFHEKNQIGISIFASIITS